MENINIRKATIEDLPTIQQLNHLLFLKEGKEYDPILNTDWPLEEAGEKYFRKAIEDEDRVALIAESAGTIVGYAVGRSWTTSVYTQHIISELDNILVLEEYRSLGAGGKLVQAFLDWSREKKAGRAIVEAFGQNSRAIAFYKKNGFGDYQTKLKIDL